MPLSGLTPKIQTLMIYSMSNNGINYRDQTIFNSSRYYKAIKFLKRNGLIHQVCSVCQRNLKQDQKTMCNKTDRGHRYSDKNIKHYELSLSGEILTMFLKRLK